MPTPTALPSTLTLTIAPQPIGVDELATDAVLVPLFEDDADGQFFSAITTAINEATGGAIAEEKAYLTHLKWACGETHVVRLPKGSPAKYAVLTGMDNARGEDKKATTPTHVRRAYAAGFKAAQTAGLHALTSMIEPLAIALCCGNTTTVKQLACWQAEAALMSTYSFKRRRTEASLKPAPFESITLVPCSCLSEDDVKAALAGATQGHIEGMATCMARDWVFDSANHVTPTFMKTQAETLTQHGLTVKSLSLDEIKDKGMGSFYSVAKGSDEHAYLVHIHYEPKTVTPTKTVALIGKGMCFDSGGYSLKPPKAMELMKLDMAGSAAVLATMHGLAMLREKGIEVPLKVDGFLALCENMVNGHASKPGDIVTTLKGTTVEINNTDAEGRLVLIDTFTYAQQQVNPDEMIDLATLTGAQVAALGERCAAIISNTPDFAETVTECGAMAGEQFWQLPLLEDYNDALKSDVADLINAGSGGKAGTASAGLFLQQFIDDNRKWAHLDIAGPAYTSSATPEVPKGATGFGVRTLLHYLLSHVSG